MRVLAVWEAPLGFPDIDDEDLTEAERLQFGIDDISPEPLGPLLDPIDGFVQEDSGDELDGEPLPSPCPFLIETGDGIAVHRHPEAFLLEDEALWSIVFEWRSGVPRELSSDHYRTRSAFWFTAWGIMCSAWNRRQALELEERFGIDDETNEGAPN